MTAKVHDVLGAYLQVYNRQVIGDQPRSSAKDSRIQVALCHVLVVEGQAAAGIRAELDAAAKAEHHEYPSECTS
eukprot:3182681-Amphidinium_carterae.1